MIDSAANTRSPTADSSMFTPVLPTVSLLDANASREDIFSSPSHSEFPTDHNTPEQKGRQSNFFNGVARRRRSVEPGGRRPLVQPLLRAVVARRGGRGLGEGAGLEPVSV